MAQLSANLFFGCTGILSGEHKRTRRKIFGNHCYAVSMVTFVLKLIPVGFIRTTRTQNLFKQVKWLGLQNGNGEPAKGNCASCSAEQGALGRGVTFPANLLKAAVELPFLWRMLSFVRAFSSACEQLLCSNLRSLSPCVSGELVLSCSPMCCCSEIGARWPLRSLPTQTIL